jgi:hypothetical protein
MVTTSHRKPVSSATSRNNLCPQEHPQRHTLYQSIPNKVATLVRSFCFASQEERNFIVAYAGPTGGIPKFYLSSGIMIFPEELILIYKLFFFLYLRSRNFKFDDRVFTDLKCYYYVLLVCNIFVPCPPVWRDLTVEI